MDTKTHQHPRVLTPFSRFIVLSFYRFIVLSFYRFIVLQLICFKAKERQNTYFSRIKAAQAKLS
ncbi:hypothetical protein QR676_19045 [Vibrio sp. TMPB1044]|uniref:hypothetical protein n=1 Tax=Vibrio sp. TMPB1044 TaxID=3051822 RepID=UPI00255B8351|nr:hypothetical protein [Vibrio sp. TMPB1044]MDL5029340.1 hypothetical protein [Vibrio sp. TMPB1044]MDN5209468.1 hypothetical protein [Vibrio sp. TMPB1044]